MLINPGSVTPTLQAKTRGAPDHVRIARQRHFRFGRGAQ
jgi:hypothetical protein